MKAADGDQNYQNKSKGVLVSYKPTNTIGDLLMPSLFCFSPGAKRMFNTRLLVRRVVARRPASCRVVYRCALSIV